MPRRFWLAAAVCPALADADVLTLGLGIDYGAFFGHRGFFHSIAFSLVIAGCAAWEFRRARGMSGARWLLLVGFLWIVTATHGVLDALTDGGLGVALLSPFDSSRYFFPWTPIAVAPMGVDFFSRAGWDVLMSEVRWVWGPLVVLCALLYALRKLLQYAIVGRRPAAGMGSQAGCEHAMQTESLIGTNAPNEKS